MGFTFSTTCTTLAMPYCHCLAEVGNTLKQPLHLIHLYCTCVYLQPFTPPPGLSPPPGHLFNSHFLAPPPHSCLALTPNSPTSPLPFPSLPSTYVPHPNPPIPPVTLTHLMHSTTPSTQWPAWGTQTETLLGPPLAATLQHGCPQTPECAAQYPLLSRTAQERSTLIVKGNTLSGTHIHVCRIP